MYNAYNCNNITFNCYLLFYTILDCYNFTLNDLLLRIYKC